LNKDKLNIEEVFKEAFDKFEVDPGKNAWEAIQAKIGVNTAASSSSAVATTSSATAGSWVATTVFVVVISAAAIGGYFFFNDSAKKVKQEKIESETIENPKETTSIGKTIAGNVNENLKESEPLIDKSIVSRDVDDNDKQPYQPIEEKIKTEKNKPTEIIEETTTPNSKSQTQINQTDNKDKQEGKVAETAPNNETSANQTKNETTSDATEESQEKSTPNIENRTGDNNETTKNEDSNKTIESYIPNVFSPNGDGTNDNWVVTVNHYDAISIKVFDKRNNLAYKAKGLDYPWDGKLMNGNLAAEGLYFYQIVIEYKGEVYTEAGTINLIR